MGNTSGRQSFFGQGAGRYPTAYNVLQDAIDFLNGIGFYGPCGPKTPVNNGDLYSYYVRGAEDGWLADNTREHWGKAVVTEPVSVETMHKWLKDHPDAFIAALPEEKK